MVKDGDVNVDDILKEIEGYDVNRENAIEFILQDKDSSYDGAFFFYKSSLLQLIQCRNHLDKMLDFYYSNLSIEFVMDVIYKSFLLGQNEMLGKIFDYAELIKEEFSKLFGSSDFDFNNALFSNSMGSLLDDIKRLDIYVKYKNAKFRELLVMDEDKSNDNVIKTIYRQIDAYNNRIKIVLNRLKSYFDDRGCEALYEEFNFDGAIIENICDYNPELCSYEEMTKGYFDFIGYYYQLIDDIVLMTSVMKGYYQIKEDIICGKSLSDVCMRIRNLLFGEENLQIRTSNLVPSNEFMASTSSASEVGEDFDKLEKQYGDVIREKDNDLFIRKCADFHFDFLRVHPFRDGNGRTSRILLTTMFLSRNILLPSLYRDDYEKSDFYVEGDTALNGDYRNIEQALYDKLGRYYILI